MPQQKGNVYKILQSKFDNNSIYDELLKMAQLPHIISALNKMQHNKKKKSSDKLKILTDNQRTVQ